MPEYLSTDPYAGTYADAEQQAGLQPGLLSAIAQQENVDPRHNNPLGLSTDSGVMTFSPEEVENHIHKQAALLADPNGPYREFARTGNIKALAQVYSPVGASNDIHGTNGSEASGIETALAKRYISTDPHAGDASATPPADDIGQRIADGQKYIADAQAKYPNSDNYASDHSAKWNAQQKQMADEAAAAGLPPAPNGNARLVDAIQRSKAAGYNFPHFSGPDAVDPKGDRSVTMDMEALTQSLAQQEAAATDPKEKQRLGREKDYWENQSRVNGMTAEQWAKQMGQPDPVPQGTSFLDYILGGRSAEQSDAQELRQNPGALTDNLVNIPPIPSDPNDNERQKIEKTIGNLGRGLISSATSPAGLAAFTNPVVAGATIAGQLPDIYREERASEQTPAWSPERHKAAADVAALLLPFAAHGLAGGKEAPVAPEVAKGATETASEAVVPKGATEQPAPIQQEPTVTQVSGETRPQPEPASAPSQERTTGDEPFVSRIANRFTEERATDGELGEIAPGEGYSTRDLVKRGLQMPPEEVAQHVSDVVNDAAGDHIAQAAAIRAEEARLSQRSSDLSRVAEENPDDIAAHQAANSAFADLTDFHNGPVAKIKQRFHATGMALQGEIPADLSTFNGLREAWLKDTGKPPPSNIEPLMQRTARNVRNAFSEERGVSDGLWQEVERQSSARKLPSAEAVRDAIVERMKEMPCRV